MKKLIVCLIGLVILSGIAMAEEKFQIRLKYDRIFRTMSLDENVVIVKDWGNDIYWSQFELTGFKNRERTKRLYAEISWQIISPLTIKSMVGIGTASIDTTPEIIDSAGYGEIYTWKRSQSLETDPVKGQSRMGFIYGFGAELRLYKNRSFEVKIDSQFLTQEETPAQINIFQMETYSSGYMIAQDILEKAEIEKAKTRELTIILQASKRLGKITISTGPMLLFAKTNYSGKGILQMQHRDYLNPHFNNNRIREIDFAFQTKNQKRIFVWAKAEYSINNQIGLVVELKNGVSGGIKINL